MILVAGGILYKKPVHFFDDDAQPKEFGCEDNQILIPYYAVGLLSGIAVYLLLTAGTVAIIKTEL
jgi:hypothetical protein